MIKTATKENAKLDLDRLIVHISNHLEFRVRGFLLHFNQLCMAFFTVWYDLVYRSIQMHEYDV